MRYVPAVPGEKITFKMDTATLKSGSGYEIKVFACEVPYKEYLRDMDAQLTYTHHKVLPKGKLSATS